MRRQAKKVDLSTHTRRTETYSSEQESREYEPVKKDEDADVCVAGENQKDSSPLKSQRMAKKNYKKKVPARQIRTTSLKDAAHAYLQLWHMDRNSWRFHKKIQYWLLKNMYSKDQVICSFV